MLELRKEVKENIKAHAQGHNTGFEGLLDLSVITTLTNLSFEFSQEERDLMISIIQKAYYVNNILVWKILALIQERKYIQEKFKSLCEKWENIETLINIYNLDVELNKAPNNSSLSLIKELSKDFAPLTIYKGGKIQLQNRHIQRTFEKLRNSVAERLQFQFLIAFEITGFIIKNNLQDYINDGMKEYLDYLSRDLAHDPKFSAIDPKKDKDKKKYAIYPKEIDVRKISQRSMELARNFLFNDLETAIIWMNRQ